MRHEIDVAVKTTLVRGFGDNHSLCHGDLGNLEFLRRASAVFHAPELSANVDRVAEGVFRNIISTGFVCGIPLGVESPGLMTGLAGIGFGLLRLADPARIPSVLVLEPPVARDGVKSTDPVAVP